MSTKPIIQFFKFQGEITKYRCLCTDHLSFRLDSRIEEYNPNLIFGTGRAVALYDQCFVMGGDFNSFLHLWASDCHFGASVLPHGRLLASFCDLRGRGGPAPGQGQNNEQSDSWLMTHSSACVALLNLMVWRHAIARARQMRRTMPKI